MKHFESDALKYYSCNDCGASTPSDSLPKGWISDNNDSQHFCPSCKVQCLGCKKHFSTAYAFDWMPWDLCENCKEKLDSLETLISALRQIRGTIQNCQSHQSVQFSPRDKLLILKILKEVINTLFKRKKKYETSNKA